MKILFLSRRAWPEIGGVEKHVLEISRELVKRGHEVTVIAEDDDVGFIRRCLADQPMSRRLARRTPLGAGRGDAFRMFRIPIGKSEKFKKFGIWRWLFKHRDLIKEADIVHAHDVGFWYWPFRFLYPKKPFFMTFHGWEEKFPVPFKNKIQRKISEKMAKGNLCVGEYLQKWYGTKADEVTYGGIDDNFNFYKNYKINKTILFIGRLEKETGIMTYLKAIRRILKPVCRQAGQVQDDNEIVPSQRDPAEAVASLPLAMTVVGDGKRKKEAENYAKKHHLAVKFLGEVVDLRVLRGLRGKARFIFAGGYLAILEAMAQRKLVFSVFGNPLKEDYLKLGKLGELIVICGSENELAEKIKFYLKNPVKEKEMTDKAYHWVKGKTWEKVAEKYLNLWER